ncbi:hypothetical protein HY484_01600 [Candidatus Woesearchaeota archaeon]|nr:hypothetical protein [Candidatus Woesearchaeota archaeon]
MRLPLWLALSGSLAVSCRAVDARLESLVNDAVAVVERSNVFPEKIPLKYEGAVLTDVRFRESVEKNLVSLLSGRDWRDVLFYCSVNNIDVSSSAVDAMNDSFAHLHFEDGRLPAFIAECLKYDDGILWKPALRSEVVRKLDVFVPFVQVGDVSQIEQIFRNYPGEQDYFRKQMLVSLTRRLDSSVWKEARRLALELPVVLEKSEYERLAADALVPVKDGELITYPSYASAMEAVGLCQKVDAELRGFNSVLLEKILAVFDSGYNLISLKWIAGQFEKKGLSSEDAVRRTLLLFLDAHQQYAPLDLYASGVGGVELPAEKDVFLINYAGSGVRNLSEVISLVSDVQNPVLRREFLRASYHHLIGLQTEESFSDAVYVAVNYQVLVSGEMEVLADMLFAAKYVNYPQDDWRHDKIIVPSFSDVEKGIYFLKNAGVSLETISRERAQNIVYALRSHFSSSAGLVASCMKLDLPRSAVVSDALIGFDQRSDGLLSEMFTQGFVPSESVAKEYCDSVLDRAVAPFKDVSAFISKYGSNHFFAPQFINYGLKRLYVRNIVSDDVRNAALAFEQGVKVKNGRRPSTLEFMTTLESVLDNPEIDCEAVLNVYSALNYDFDFSRRLSVVDSLQVGKKIGEVAKLYCYARTAKNVFVEDKLKHSLVLNIKSARDSEIQQCVYFLSESESSSAYISLLGDFLFEQGRVLSARFCWEKSGYMVGVESVDKMLARKEVGVEK